jgi:hypothetical protein
MSTGNSSNKLRRRRDVIKLLGASSNPWSFLQPTHPMIQTMYKFFACRAGMRSEDPKDRNPRNFDNGSNLNWRGIFLFVVYTSVVVGVFLFSQNGNHGSVDGPAPRLSYDERNSGRDRFILRREGANHRRAPLGSRFRMKVSSWEVLRWD